MCVNSRNPSFPFFKFQLSGNGKKSELLPYPPLITFPGDLLILTNYNSSISLFNRAKANVNYSIFLKENSSESFIIKLTGENLIYNEELKCYKGFSNIEELKLNINVSSTSPGLMNACFIGEVEDGSPFNFIINCNFVGPTIFIVESEINFGLIKANSRNEFRLNIENKSNIPAELILKQANSPLDFDFLDQSPDNFQLASNQLKTQENVASFHSIKIDPQKKMLNPHENSSFLVILQAGDSETVEEFLELKNKNSFSQFIRIYAEIQKPHISLSVTKIDLGKTYAGLKYTIDSKHKSSMNLFNFGNIDAQFQWEEMVDPTNLIVTFEPARGIIKARSKMNILINVNILRGGHIKELFVCDVSDMDYPLGFELISEVFGLSVEYFLYDQALARKIDTKSSLKDTKSFLQKLLPEAKYDKEKTFKAVDEFSEKKEIDKVKQNIELNLNNCVINKSYSSKFVIRNNSGIKAYFNVHSKNFEPSAYPEVQNGIKENEREDTKTERSESNTLKSKDSLISRTNKSILNKTKGKHKKEIKLKHYILSEAYEQTHKFASDQGATFTTTQMGNKEQLFFLQNNKAIAVVCQPHIGEIPPYSEVCITVSIYNNICGKFDDIILSEIKGLPIYEIPVAINIKGCPVIIPPSQVGLYYTSIPPALVMNPLMVGGPKQMKSFLVQNTGVESIEIEWKLYDISANSRSNSDLFRINIIKNEGISDDKFLLDFEAIEPEQESTESQFSINPKNVQLPVKGKMKFEVTFDPKNDEGIYNCALIAHPYFTKENEENRRNLGVISLSLIGTTISPYLTIGKCLRMNDEHVLQFKCWSVESEDAPSPFKIISLTNNKQTDISFNLNITGPFSLVSTKTNALLHPLERGSASSKSLKTKTKVMTMFQLQPSKVVDVKIKANKPIPTEKGEWPLIEQVIKKGKIEIFYTNGTKQFITLEMDLFRPIISLETEKWKYNEKNEREIDFGIIFLGWINRY